MNTNIPTLPPSFLDRCLALSEHLYAMKSGSAKLEASPSHFLFTVDHPPGNKESGPSHSRTGWYSPYGRWKMKKKTPSDLRRDARRHKKFLEKKRNFSQPAAFSSNSPPSTNLQSSVDFSNLSSISETPLLVENNEDMDTESSDQPSEAIPEKDVKESLPVEESLPVISSSRNNSESIDAAQALSSSSPAQPKNHIPMNESRDSPAQPEELFEVYMMICAVNKKAAIKRSNQFPNHEHFCSHESDKTHHFMFSINANSEYVSKLKTNINKFEDLQMFQVAGDDEKFQPDGDDPNHCQQCHQSGVYTRWCES